MTGSHGAAFHCGTHADSLVPVYREITEDSALLTCLIQVQQHGFKVVVAQAALHQPLECSWGVAEPEWHTVELAEAHWRRECSLLLVRLCHGNLPIPTGKNIALEGKASQSSVYHMNGNALNAIDGNRDGAYRMKSCILTKSDYSAWWRVDLSEPRKIGAVVVANRKDCCWKRLIGAEIRIGNATKNQNPVCGTITEAEPGLVTRTCCAGMVGRYVSIVLPNREEILNLCEVEIYPEGIEKQCV
ncbi:fucolectin-like isoform 3-T3 [Anomaloglossus baeobatrachus]